MNVLFRDVVLQRTARNCAKVRLARASRKLISLLVPAVLVGVGVFVVTVSSSSMLKLPIVNGKLWYYFFSTR